jgi:uncharacterized integral membrane protein
MVFAASGGAPGPTVGGAGASGYDHGTAMSAPSEKKPVKETESGGRGPREMLRTGGLIALGALAVLFATLNLEEVRVDWIIGSGHAPLIIVIVVAVLVGIVMTYLAERVNRRRR